jgi:hypothetical protein
MEKFQVVEPESTGWTPFLSQLTIIPISFLFQGSIGLS